MRRTDDSNEYDGSKRSNERWVRRTSNASKLEIIII